MKAVVVVSHGQAEVRDIPPPQPGPFEALVKIEACGLCGTTDRHIVEGHQAHHSPDWYPAILGHESVGSVVEVGNKVRKFQIGDRVTRPTALWPGTQRDGLYSAWGGFAEYGIVRETGLPDGPLPDYVSQRQQIVPPDSSLEDAVLAISISEVASWMGKISDISGKTVVIGGTGFAACVMCQCARMAGARQIIALGRSERKFDWVKRNGATHALFLNEKTAAEIQAVNGGVGADYFLDAAGHQDVFSAGLHCLRPGGEAAIYGAPDGFAYRLPLGATGGDFTVRYLSPTDDTFFPEACRQIAARKIDPTLLLTHRWHGLESISNALSEQKSGAVLKGLIHIA